MNKMVRIVYYSQLKYTNRDMESLFQEFRKDSGIVYPPFASAYFEKYFFNYMKLFHSDLFNTYIPVFWTEIQISSYNKTKLQQLLTNLEKEKEYFAVVQHADGIHVQLPPNTIQFGMGSPGKRTNGQVIPLPLIYETTDRRFVQKTTTKQDIFCSFVGSMTHECRKAMLKPLQGNPNIYISITPWTNKVPIENQTKFIDITRRSRFTLAPRGYGPTSFRLYEAFVLDSVPVYIYDTPWLPYTELIDWSKMAVLVPIHEIDSLYTRLQSITDLKLQEMKNYYEKHKHLFTYKGASEYICSKIEQMTDGTNGANGANGAKS
jgi:hypothetical protein